MSLQVNASTDATALKPKKQRNANWLSERDVSAMSTVERTIAQIAPTNIPVLLTGESGTGKAFVAQQIHNLSLRKDGSLTKVVSASAVNGSLGLYFGRSTGPGVSPQERMGTLFLKEISELDRLCQRDLLYALSTSSGGHDGDYWGPRLISSTVADLEEEMRFGRFRTELYYRINAANVYLPPLRERRQDIAVLLDSFLAQQALLQGRNRPHLDAEDIGQLSEFYWPGNIRQLENVAKKMVVLNDPKVVIAEILANQAEPRLPASGVEALPLKVATRAAARRAEREMILAALDKNRWNRKRAAAELKISYKSLLCKLKEIGPASTEI